MRHGPDCLAADLAGRIDPERAVRSQRLNARMSGNRCWCHCSRRPQRSRRYTGRNLPRLRHSSTRPAMLHASETAQLECRMGRGQVESGGDAAPHRPARCGHRLSHRDGHRAFDAARDGHSICAQANWGQPCRKGQEGRRKVLRWSREPWRDADDVGHAALPPGRFVSGITQTDVGEVTIIGVCLSLIPLAGGSMLEPEDAGGPRGVSAWPCRIAETGSRSAPRRGGRFQPADRAAQCNAAPPPCSPPVHPRPEPAHRHHKLGLSGAKNHRPHRA